MDSRESGLPWFGIADATFSYGEHVVFENLGFSLKKGESHALIGHHNEGKSTLCNIMSGRLDPDSGLVIAEGVPYKSISPGKAKELGICHVSKSPNIYSRLSVTENLLSGKTDRWLGLLPFRRHRKKLAAWLSENGISLPLHLRMDDLPRDMWVVVNILSQLYVSPKLLILDEALEEVLQPWLSQILAVIRKRLRDGMSLLWVTHKIEDALLMTDRISVMRRGSIILSDDSINMERLSLVRLCYSQLDEFDEAFDNQEKFQELVRYTEAILRDLPTAVFILDPHHNLRFANRSGRNLFHEKLLGATRDDLFGESNTRFREMVLGDAEAGRDVEYHGVPLTLTDRKFLADVRVQTIMENNVKVGTMVIIEDVSLRENLRSRLMLSERLASIGLLAAGVAHEVNNPLEVLSNYLNYLKGDPSGHEAQEVMGMMEEEISRIQQITNNLVAYSDGKPLCETVDIMQLLRELAVLLSFHAEFRNVELKCTGPDDVALVYAASNELRQIFLNLFRNSRDAMPNGGKITTEVTVVPDENNGGKVMVAISDSGTGIQLDDPNDIFMPFVTTKKSDASHQGLGLYIVYGIIEKYGGKIEVENLVIGGCKFTINFPLTRPEKAAKFAE